MIYNNNVHNLVTAELVEKVLKTNIDQKNNGSLILDCGKLHYFDLDESKQGLKGKSIDFSTVFMNKLEMYFNSLGFTFSIFGCLEGEEGNKIYEVTISNGFNNKIYKTLEFDNREEALLDAATYILNNELKNSNNDYNIKL
jgi:hypothetical protein